MRSLGSDYLAYALIDAVIDNYYPVLEVYAERLDEHLLSGRPPLPEMLEREQLARAEPEWRHGLLDPAAGPTRELRNQKARRRRRPSVGSGRSHCGRV